MLLKSALLCLCVVWTVANGDGVDPGPGPVITNTTLAPITIKPTSSTEAPTTPAPNSTTAAPKTTTPTPTTTLKPNTTTTAPTTTPAPTTSSTTPKPTSPTPKPDNKLAVNEFIGNYSGTKNICLMVKMAVEVEVLKKGENSTMIKVPKNPKFVALCPSKTEESLTINWDNNSVSFGFFKNNSKFEIQSINVTLSATNKTLYHKKPEFSVSEKLSYYCAKDQALNLTAGTTNNTWAKVHLSHLQYQAFVNQTQPNYASVWDCDGVNTTDIVPVVVGCVLAILVILVLVAYLFGRRRCQARGYLSM